MERIASSELSEEDAKGVPFARQVHWYLYDRIRRRRW